MEKAAAAANGWGVELLIGAFDEYWKIAVSLVVGGQNSEFNFTWHFGSKLATMLERIAMVQCVRNIPVANAAIHVHGKIAR